MSHENVEIVRRFLDVDVESALTLADPEIVWNPIEESSAQGHDAVRASLERWKGEWDDYELIVEELADMGDKVVATVRPQGRGRGSGVEIDARFYDVYTVRDAKIVRMDQFTEESEALAAARPPDGVEVLRRMLDAFNHDDVEAVVAHFAADCEIKEPPEMPDSPSSGYRGHAGIRDWMTNLRGVAEAGFEARHFEPAGESLLCELASSGLGQASGVPVEWKTYALVDLRDEKIARIRVFLSREEALADAGRPG